MRGQRPRIENEKNDLSPRCGRQRCRPLRGLNRPFFDL